jgi:polar amino acid transport system substrate-binding protein
LSSRLAVTLLIAAAWSPVSAITVGVDVDSPPFMYQVGERAAGVYPAVISAVFARMNEPATIVAMPWKRVMAEIDIGAAGAGGIYKNQERLRKYDFSDPILPETIVVYYNKTKPIDFHGIADLYGKHVGVIRG